jgi:hypothetical protein
MPGLADRLVETRIGALLLKIVVEIRPVEDDVGLMDREDRISRLVRLLRNIGSSGI